MKIPLIRLDADLPVPHRAHPGDGAVDLRSTESFTLQPGERRLAPTGIAIAIPDGYAGLVVPRSGLAIRHGISVVNGPGLVDSGYRGELKVVLINLGSDPFDVERGERIAQLMVVPVASVEFVEVDELPPSSRGEGGFGSTGA